MDEALCTGCQICLTVCPYEAITRDEARRVSAGERGAVHGLRHVRRELPEQRDPAVRVQRRAGDRRAGHAARAGAGARSWWRPREAWPWPRRLRSRGDERGGGPAAWEPRIVAFLCYWCSYTGADNAGTARMKYPPNVDIINVMCSGRIDPELVTDGLRPAAPTA